MATRTEHDLSSSPLARSAASGVRWTSLAGGLVAALNLVQTLIVARLLEPRDFGLMAAATVVIALGAAFADAGLASAVVVRRTTRETLSSLYWLNLLMGIAIALIVVAIAPAIAAFYDEPRLENIVRLAACAFVFVAVGQQFGWLLERSLRFRQLGIVQIASALIGTAATLVAAALGAGVYALVTGMLVTALITALCLARIGWREWRPLLRFRWRDVRGYMDFGLYQMGERTINYLSSNLDYILIGRFLGPTSLGSYSIAYQLAIKPVSYVNPMLNRVAFPVLAVRKGDDEALRRGYLHVVRLIAYVTLPLLVGLAVVAADAVPVVLGDTWKDSAPVLAILCGVGVLRSLGNPVGSILLAKNRPDLGFKGNVLTFAAMAAALVVAVHSGIMAVAWASVGVTLLVTLGWLLVLRKLVGLSLSAYAHMLSQPLAFSAVMVAAMEAAHVAMAQADLTRAVDLIVVCIVGALVYGGLLARFDAPYVADLWRLFRGRGPVPAAT